MFQPKTSFKRLQSWLRIIEGSFCVLAHPAVRGLGAFVRLLLPEFDCPLIEKFLVQERPRSHLCVHNCAVPLVCPHTNLFFGHVQQSHRVSLTLDVCSDGVQSFVKLPLNISQLLKHFAG